MERKDEENGPPSKRLKLDQDLPTTSRLANDSSDSGDALSGSVTSSSENIQERDREMDHDYDDSMDGMDIMNVDLAGLVNEQFEETAWHPVAGPISWVQRQITLGANPREILQEHFGADCKIPDSWSQMRLWEVLISLLMEPKPRMKLPNINTLDDVVGLLQRCQNIIVLTGAGVSVSCGIPDFRSHNGIYARLSKDFPNLPDPQAMFDIKFFKSDPRPFFKFAKEIYPGQIEPSLCHKFIKHLETKGKLLRNYTQNIDTLEKIAGIERTIECHGSFATASCMNCKYSVDAEAIREDIFDQRIPSCPRCGPNVDGAIMKPDIVFFGESLGEKFHTQMAADKNVCDLLIVIGSSLKVRPVALIPSSLEEDVPQIIINRERLSLTFDVELLGNCDGIVSKLCERLGAGWEHLTEPGPPTEEIDYDDLSPMSPACVTDPFSVVDNEKSIEQNIDSGMEDFETVTPSCDRVPVHPTSSAIGNITGRTDIHGDTTGDRLERFGSSDSGAESSSTMDTPGHVDTAVSELWPCGSDSLSSENQDNVHSTSKSCVEVSAQEECVSEQNHISETIQQSCQVDESSPSVKAGPHHPLPSFLRHQNKSPVVDQSESEKHHPTSKASGSHKRHSCHSHSHKREDDKIDLEGESKKDNAHCSATDTGEEMRQTWELRSKVSIAHGLKENQFFHIPPNKYIFHGAQVFSDDSDSDSSEDLTPLSHEDDTTPPLSPSHEDDTTPPLSPNHEEDSDADDNVINKKKNGSESSPSSPHCEETKL